MTDDELYLLTAEQNIQAMNDFCDVMEGKKKIILPEVAFKKENTRLLNMNIPIYTAKTVGGFVAVGYFYIDKESAKPTIAGYLIFDDDNKVMPLYDNFRVLYDTLKLYKTVNLESAEAINFGCPTVDEILKSRGDLK